MTDRSAAPRINPEHAPAVPDRGRRAVIVTVANAHVDPDPRAPLHTQYLHGEHLFVPGIRPELLDAPDGWLMMQSAVDRYIAYVREADLGLPFEPTHRVSVPLALVFPAPDIKVPPTDRLPLNGSVVAGPAELVGSERFHAVPQGFVLAQHLVPVDTFTPDWVAVAEQFIGTPYLWGGKSWLGIDCSGLVQVALAAAGIKAPRDSSYQGASVGAPIKAPAARGDLVFWRGHVGIMVDGERLLHANGYHHAVVIEPLADVVARHEAKGLPVAIRRRLA